MSDSDDTDTLLLVPPDYFVINFSDSDITEAISTRKRKFKKPQYSDVVHSLITQVSKLDSRIKGLETNSTRFPIRERNMRSSQDNVMRSIDDLYLMKRPNLDAITPGFGRKSSFDPSRKFQSLSTTKKYDKRYRSFDDTNLRTYYSADAESINRSEKGTVLSEIDKFIDNVKTIKHRSAQKNLIPLFDQEKRQSIVSKPFAAMNSSEKASAVNRLNLKDVDKMLAEIETEHKSLDARLESKENQYLLRQDRESFCYTKSPWKDGNNKGSVPDHGHGMRDIMYSSTASQSTVRNPVEENVTRKTIRPRNVEVSSDYHNNSFSSATSETDYSQNTAVRKGHGQYFSTPTKDDASKKLLSLNELWGPTLIPSEQHSMSSDPENPSRLSLKLEEEKLRRQHCEKTIQEMQLMLLETQQKVAVAMQVDSAKDAAILELKSSWEKLMTKTKQLEFERSKLSMQLAQIKEKTQEELEEAQQKAAHYEREVTKALDLAHDNKEKVSFLEKERAHFSDQVSTLNSELEISNSKLTSVLQTNEKLTQTITVMEKEAQKERNKASELQKELAKLKKLSESLQTENDNLKQENEQLQTKLKEEYSKKANLENQKRNLQNALDTARKNEKSHLDEVQKVIQQAENTKTELRDFYQQQVENVVKEKLKEFQGQLEQAEKALQDELRTRELSIASSAAQQLHRLTEKHQLEIKLLEEKNSEEIRLYQLQLSQSLQQIEALNLKIQQQQIKKTHIAEKLHGVMEAQWVEALKIINSKSPQNTNEEHFINSTPVKSKSSHPTGQEDISLDFKKTSTRHSKGNETSETHDDNNHQRLLQGTSNTSNEEGYQKYIHLFLNKPANFYLEDPTKENSKKSYDAFEQSKTGVYAKNKPPWK